MQTSFQQKMLYWLSMHILWPEKFIFKVSQCFCSYENDELIIYCIKPRYLIRIILMKHDKSKNIWGYKFWAKVFHPAFKRYYTNVVKTYFVQACQQNFVCNAYVIYLSAIDGYRSLYIFCKNAFQAAKVLLAIMCYRN